MHFFLELLMKFVLRKSHLLGRRMGRALYPNLSSGNDVFVSRFTLQGEVNCLVAVTQTTIFLLDGECAGNGVPFSEVCLSAMFCWVCCCTCPCLTWSCAAYLGAFFHTSFKT